MPDSLTICADENIPCVDDAFRSFGTVRTRPGRSIEPEHLTDTDVLLVRSVTRVGPDLLSDTPVRFVGSATIGTDHIDRSYLEEAGIAFAHAPASNADSVADYVIAALLDTAVRRGISLSECTIGIVGCGNIGGRLARRLPNLGASVLLNDPPRRNRGERPSAGHAFRSLEEVLAASDVVTLHTPLTTSGPHPTHHLFDRETIRTMNDGAWLVNTSRGPVVDNRALLDALRDGPVGAAVLDVWEDEPEPMEALIRKADIATPHIAGYARDGKLRGTKMLYDAFCRFANAEATWSPAAALAPDEPDDLRCTPPDPTLPATDYLDTLVRQAYDISSDDARFRTILDAPAEERGVRFSRQRKTYPVRRELQQFQVPESAVPDAYAGAVRRGLEMTLAPDADPAEAEDLPGSPSDEDET
jgi:erythronate-4-phosphate dehydrogenase